MFPVAIESGGAALEQQHHRMMSVIEETLLREYGVARAELDDAISARAPASDMKAICERYMIAMRRLRLFLEARQTSDRMAVQSFVIELLSKRRV